MAELRRFRAVNIDFKPVRRESTNNNNINNNDDESCYKREKSAHNHLHVSEQPRFLVRGSHMRSTIREIGFTKFEK